MDANNPNAMCVLVVDDHADGAHTLAELVTLFGHKVATALHPQTAIEIVTGGFLPDAILMDIGLPGMDGYQLAQKLCDALPRRPLLVAMTGFGNIDDQSRAAGFDRHLLKPVEPVELEKILKEHAERLDGATCGA